MRRSLTILIVLAGLIATAVADGQAPTSKLALSAAVQDCHAGLTPDQRYAVFVGQMPALVGTKRMAMRFDLYQHLTAPGFQHLSVPKFGTWQRSLAKQTGFIIQKRIDALVAPADYRVVVSYRWYDAAGKVQRNAQRTSPACKQPDMRPNLNVGKVGATRSGTKGTLDYAIVVRNAGLSDAGPFAVLMTVNGITQPAQQVAGLPAGAKVVQTFAAPACTAGSAITVQLDPQNLVAESNETDNTFTRPCP